MNSSIVRQYLAHSHLCKYPLHCFATQQIWCCTSTVFLNNATTPGNCFFFVGKRYIFYNNIEKNVRIFLFVFVIVTGNIVRGTMDPEIDSVTWIKFGNNITPLELQIWPPDGATCMSSKFGHQMVPLESLALPHCLGLPYWHYLLVLSWYLHQLESYQLSLHNLPQSLT